MDKVKKPHARGLSLPLCFLQNYCSLSSPPSLSLSVCIIFRISLLFALSQCPQCISGRFQWVQVLFLLFFLKNFIAKWPLRILYLLVWYHVWGQLLITSCRFSSVMEK